jgi:hypothetical protein
MIDEGIRVCGVGVQGSGVREPIPFFWLGHVIRVVPAARASRSKPFQVHQEIGDCPLFHDGSTWITLSYPGSANTNAYGIDGNNIVGEYQDSNSVQHGFLYDGTAWATLDYPGATATFAQGVDGSNIVGNYSDTSNISHGFLNSGTTSITLDYPGASQTCARDISGDRVVGYYLDSGGVTHGFLLTVPEPSCVCLLAFGGLALLGRRRPHTD